MSFILSLLLLFSHFYNMLSSFVLSYFRTFVLSYFRTFVARWYYTILLTKTTAAQNEVALSYRSVRGLYFLAVVFAATIQITILVFLGNIMRHSNPLLLWIFLHMGVITTICFCFLVSVFFRFDIYYDYNSNHKM